MLDVIEKLLILQDRDRRISQVQSELAAIAPQRTMLQAKDEKVKAQVEAAKLRARQLESERKKLELDVEAKKELIGKYALQQFQTKKNEEYRALAHEIDGCKALIVKLEDQQLELMEQAEAVQRELAEANKALAAATREVTEQLAALSGREKELRQREQELTSNRSALVDAVDVSLLQRYERIRKNKGDRVLVGIEHSVCGGCHMRLPTQVLISCQGAQEVVSCINCGRILYFTPEMDMAAAD